MSTPFTQAAHLCLLWRPFSRLPMPAIQLSLHLFRIRHLWLLNPRGCGEAAWPVACLSRRGHSRFKKSRVCLLHSCSSPAAKNRRATTAIKPPSIGCTAPEGQRKSMKTFTIACVTALAFAAAGQASAADMYRAPEGVASYKDTPKPYVNWSGFLLAVMWVVRGPPTKWPT